MMPTVTSASTYGTKTSRRNTARPRKRRLSSSAIAEGDRALDQQRPDQDDRVVAQRVEEDRVLEARAM